MSGVWELEASLRRDAFELDALGSFKRHPTVARAVCEDRNGQYVDSAIRSAHRKGWLLVRPAPQHYGPDKTAAGGAMAAIIIDIWQQEGRGELATELQAVLAEMQEEGVRAAWDLEAKA